jgi:hypothetical protein
VVRILASAKNSFKDFLFNLETWKIGVFVAVIILSLVFIVVWVINSATAFVNWRILGLYVVLTLLLTFSRMSRFTKVGIKFSYFLLFMITITLGPLTAIVLRVISVPIRLWMFLADLPFKSFLKTKEDYIFKQWAYSALSIFIIWLFVKIIGVGVVVSNLSLYYLILYGGWTIGLLVLHILFPRDSLTRYFINSGAGFVFNWFLVTSMGRWLYGYLNGFI